MLLVDGLLEGLPLRVAHDHVVNPVRLVRMEVAQPLMEGRVRSGSIES